MPRPKGKPNSSGTGAGVKAEGVAPYFRKIFNTHRKLLRTRSNEQVLKMWEEDHPQYNGIPDNVKTGLANVKSVMRSKLHKRGGRPPASAAASPQGTTTAVAKPHTTPLLSTDAADSGLEKLEIMIDECMTFAHELDIKGLDNVIHALRIARRKVVWKLGGD